MNLLKRPGKIYNVVFSFDHHNPKNNRDVVFEYILPLHQKDRSPKKELNYNYNKTWVDCYRLI